MASFFSRTGQNEVRKRIADAVKTEQDKYAPHDPTAPTPSTYGDPPPSTFTPPSYRPTMAAQSGVTVSGAAPADRPFGGEQPTPRGPALTSTERVPTPSRPASAPAARGATRVAQSPYYVMNATAPNTQDDFLKAAEARTAAIAGAAGDDLQKAIGAKLGDLNAIGALRSGATTAALRDISGDYSKNVSRAAGENALEYARMKGQLASDNARTASIADLAMLDREERSLDREESARRWESEFGEGQRQFDVEGDLEGRRFGEDTRRFDLGYGLDRDRFGEDTRRARADETFRGERAGRSDYESDRQFGYQGTRDTRADYESDRDFSFTGDRAKRADYEFDTGFGEDRRRFEIERQDAINEAKRKRKASKWGAFGAIAGGIIGSAGGPAGAMAGASVGGSLGGAV